MITKNIEVNQGATYVARLTIKDSATGSPIDISAWTFRGQVRKTYSSTSVSATFTPSIIDGPNGIVEMSLSATDTSAIAADPAVDYKRKTTYLIYDMEAVRSDSTVLRIMQGSFALSPEVTRT